MIASKQSKILFFSLLAQGARFFKMSFIVGSYSGFFSAVSFMGPISGKFVTPLNSLVIYGCSLVIRIMICGFNPFILLVHHLPGLCASLYFNTRHWGLSRLLPLSCMALFIMHPVGQQAWPYALFWTIPVLLSFLNRSLVTDCVTSTFIAHGVGSVIWLYAKPMVPALWIGLIPVVVIERFLIVIGMINAYHLFVYAGSVVNIFKRIYKKSVDTIHA